MEILFTLKDMQTFVLLAEDLSFTTVAARRNTVQSAVSAQIKRLEAALGQRLVARGRGQTVQLTSEGEAFLIYAKRILALSTEAVETAQTAKARHILRLGTTVTLALSLVAEGLGPFAAARPDVQIQIQCDRSDQLLQRLEEGDVDIAFMMDQGRHNLRRWVQTLPLQWVCASHFTLSDRTQVPLAFLTDGRDLRRYALEALDGAGLQGHVSHLSPHPIGVRALVQAGLALTVMPAGTITAPLRVAPAALGLPPLSPIALSVYHRRREGLDSDEALIAQLDAVCKAACAAAE